MREEVEAGADELGQGATFVFSFLSFFLSRLLMAFGDVGIKRDQENVP